MEENKEKVSILAQIVNRNDQLEFMLSPDVDPFALLGMIEVLKMNAMRLMEDNRQRALQQDQAVIKHAEKVTKTSGFDA